MDRTPFGMKALYQNKDKGALKDLYDERSGLRLRVLVLVCTELRDNPGSMVVVRFSDGDDDWNRSTASYWPPVPSGGS